MDWLTELCRVLAYIVLERYDKSVSFARTLDITPPSGELVKAIVIVKFSLPARVDIKQRVNISDLPVMKDVVYNVSGDPGTTVSITAPDYAERMAAIAAQELREAATP